MRQAIFNRGGARRVVCAALMVALTGTSMTATPLIAAAQEAQSSQATHAAPKSSDEDRAKTEKQVQDAQSSLDSAKGKLATADETLATQKKALDTSKAATKKAQDAYDAALKGDGGISDAIVKAGTVGFMRYVQDGSFTDAQKADAAQAISWLTGATNKPSWYDRYVDLSSTDSPTSIKNLQNALTYMDAVNAIRSAHGLNQLTISLKAMAAAELNASYSSNVWGHSGEYYNSENLASGGGAYTGSTNPADFSWPFNGWYNQEKVIWEDAVKKNPALANMGIYEIYQTYPDLFQEVGHYLNFIDPDLRSFGIGVGKGKGGTQDVTTFDAYGTSGSFTVSEFKSVVGDYLASGQSEQVKQAKKALDDARAAQQRAQQKVNTAQAARDDAAKAVATAQSALDAANKEFYANHTVWSRFSDTEKDAWYVYPAGLFDYAIENGLMNGYANTDRFGTYDSITRGQVACVLWNMAGNPARDSAPFDDVNYDAYYGDAIKWARATGVISGFAGTNNFAPDANVSRQDLACMMRNYAMKIAGDKADPAGSAAPTRSDWNQVSAYAKDSVAWADKVAIMQGKDAGNGKKVIDPHAQAWRASAATMAAQLDKLLAE